METSENGMTTLKISKKTKNRLDNLKEYRRESYEEIIQKILEILNMCKIQPAKAQARLIGFDARHKENVQRAQSEREL